MNDMIAHRGPDGNKAAFFTTRGMSSEDSDWAVGFGHLRLSIIDLDSTGDQPMSYDNQSLWIIFNGEIYNYVELKQVLEADGLAFNSTSDTEVILAAYHKWGTACFERLRGMWGLIIYDRKRGKLIASRDRMGIKPLYYFQHNGYIAFASEIKQFLALPEFTPRADKAVIKEYLNTGFEVNNRTFFENVVPLLPGTFMEIEVRDPLATVSKSYWNPETIVPDVDDYDLASGRFAEEFRRGVSIHLRSDVPVGCQLSGGVDSSAVFALMQKEYKVQHHVHSFTVRFPGYEKDETPFVDKILAGTGAVPHFTTPDAATFLDDLKEFIWHHDEPVGSFAHYAGFALAKLIRSNHIKVVLNGQGGDEILGGYWQQYFSYLFSLTRRGNFASLAGHFVNALASHGNEELVTQVPAMLRRYRSRNRAKPFRFTPQFEKEPPLHFYGNYFNMSESARRVFDIRNLILPRLLKWDDRNLMAFGVEGRYPFLDHRVIETALSFNTKTLYKDGWTKYPLRMAMRDTIPKDIYFRKSKWGFETPQQNWLAGPLKPAMYEWANRDKPLDDIIRRDDTGAIRDKFMSGRKLEDAQMLLRLFLLDQWLQIFSVRI
jgi:asparagine synthase (glutamine-hydrolysing)